MIQKEYEINNNFRDYVDKYAKERNISVEEALEHKLVEQAYCYYKEERESKL